MYRDLKCENLLLDVNNTIKISDFGFARRFEVGEMCRTFCGSAAYAAPEILQGIPYEPTGYDLWSMGVILYIMVRVDNSEFLSNKGLIRVYVHTTCICNLHILIHILMVL